MRSASRRMHLVGRTLGRVESRSEPTSCPEADSSAASCSAGPRGCHPDCRTPLRTRNAASHPRMTWLGCNRSLGWFGPRQPAPQLPPARTSCLCDRCRWWHLGSSQTARYLLRASAPTPVKHQRSAAAAPSHRSLPRLPALPAQPSTKRWSVRPMPRRARRAPRT